LARSDFPLLQKWLAATHVTIWWNEPFDLASLEAKYGPGIDGREPVHVYLIELDCVPIGWIRWYRWRDFPNHANQLGADRRSAGFDFAIGEIEMTGRGLGPAVIRQFGTKYIFASGDVDAIVADPEVSNLHSVSAFKKAGFNLVRKVQLIGEDFERHVVRWNRDEE
jgi:aminoglycoside 6'-N-acetyltransferase